jgi:replicative DNA helicase
VGEFTDRARHAQRLLWGAVLTDPAVLPSIVEDIGVAPDHFHGDHGTMFRAALRLVDEGRSIDAFTVADVAGMSVSAVREAADRPAKHQDPAEYARVVLEEAAWRIREDRFLDVGLALQRRDEVAYDTALAKTDVQIAAEDVLLPEHLYDLTYDFLSQDTSGSVFPLPWEPLNRALSGGFRSGDTTVVAGWSSDGKSLVAGQILDRLGSMGANVCLLTNEMKPVDVVLRGVASRSGVKFRKLLRGIDGLEGDEPSRVLRALAKFPYPISPVFGKTAGEICSMMRRRRWDLVVLDLFNRLPGRGSTQEVDEMITMLCDAAAVTGTHLIVVCQINRRGIEKGVRPMPTGADLRESGALYTHPANCLFVYREQKEVEGRIERQPEGTIYFDKVRNGPADSSASIKVWLNESEMRFVERSL